MLTRPARALREARGAPRRPGRVPEVVRMSRLTCCMSPVAARAGRPSSAARRDSPRAESCREIILHPKFAHLAEAPPEVFCPMDWLPDEVISNVLVHLVRLPRDLAPPARARTPRRARTPTTRRRAFHRAREDAGGELSALLRHSEIFARTT